MSEEKAAAFVNAGCGCKREKYAPDKRLYQSREQRCFAALFASGCTELPTRDVSRGHSNVTHPSSQRVRTMCPMNCHPTLCGMLAEVREGKLLGVHGDRDNPDSQGFLCIRGQASREVIDNPARLLHPLVRDRRDAEFRRASWDEAFERIVAGMQNPAAVGFWAGHGTATTNYGTRISNQLITRFANFFGAETWSPSMICWGLGAYGLGLTGLLETNTKEDMGRHSDFIVLWAANFASQPNSARYVLEAKKRGATIVTIDVRHTEAAAKSDDVLIIRPGSDTALALAMIHVICAENLYDADFVEKNTVGFGQLAAHVEQYTPQWAAEITGIPAERIADLARRYARSRPAMIMLGGSSMHKGRNGWLAARAISCLPALTGNIGIAGGGLGPRHGSGAHGRGLRSIAAPERRTTPQRVPNQMPAITAALCDGHIQTMMLMGTNMVSSYADTGEVARGLQRARLVVSYDLFLNDTARRFADVVLPSTCWLEELGCKMSHTHLYLMEPALPPAGETRSVHAIVRELADRLGLDGFHPWASEEAMIDAILDHPCTGHATVAALRAEGGMRALDISHVANPDLDFDTPSRKIEFVSELADRHGLPALPTWIDDDVSTDPKRTDETYPLELAQGRTMLHFHGFYNSGQALPTLAKRESEPHLWISEADASARKVDDGGAIRIFNGRGEMKARAHVTDRIPAGTVWMRDGWPGLNTLTSGAAVLPDAAADLFEFTAGQASFDARVEVEAV
ncbi:MAG: molybdopterin-dependent oxidoreductase [Betaproteobacteria bacterium]|nr:molybdopterin-dependent oxidoreductase [Betaproteobacteria bacterium]